MLLREVFSYGRVFMRVRIRDRLCFIVAGDGSIKLAVSWLKFEPWSRILAVKKSIKLDFFTFTTNNFSSCILYF